MTLFIFLFGAVFAYILKVCVVWKIIKSIFLVFFDNFDMFIYKIKK